MEEHIPVLLHETVDSLPDFPKGIYVDCTVGRGGHSAYLCATKPIGHLYAFDQDQEAIEKASKRLEENASRITFIHQNFVHLQEALHSYDVHEVAGIMMDLGVSSPQFDEKERGFSYRMDARLDMRMDRRQSLSAYEIVNQYDLPSLTKIFREYGEEPYAYEIAKQIVKEREKQPIETTFQLVDVIKKALPMKVLKKKGHPAKQVFQAIRIAVNDELHVLEEALQEALSLLQVGGRLAVISFHSLEDRIVKHAFLKASTKKPTPRGLPTLVEDEPSYRLVNRHPILADEDEQIKNPRSKSAKLRVIERIKKGCEER